MTLRNVYIILRDKAIQIFVFKLYLRVYPLKRSSMIANKPTLCQSKNRKLFFL